MNESSESTDAGAMPARRTWFITGASSGLGRALAHAVLDRGDAAVLASRRPSDVGSLAERFEGQAWPVALDVTDRASIERAVADAVAAFGRVDVLVNNAGYGLLGAVEELSEAELRAQMETNFFGAFAVTQAALPLLRQQRRGHVINISSEGGIVGVPGAAAYNASKFALEGFSEALAAETAHLGLRVTIVEPGALRTDWAGRSLAQAERRIADYTESSGAVRDFVPSTDGQQAGDPAKAAQAIIAIADADRPPLRLVLGTDAAEHIEAKLDVVRADMRGWAELTASIAVSEPVA